jgi:hypothetical protein
MNKVIASSCLAATLCGALPAAAQVAPAMTIAASTEANTGNLPADFYPRNTCIKPDASKVDRLDYNQTIRYNRMVKEYAACSKSYLANARADSEYVLAMINAQVGIVDGTAVPPMPSAPGNLPAGFYPASSCIRPDRAAIGTVPSVQSVPVIAATGKPKSADGQQALDTMAAYNQRVTRYNLETATFSACSKDYIAKGHADLAHLQAATQAPD